MSTFPAGSVPAQSVLEALSGAAAGSPALPGVIPGAGSPLLLIVLFLGTALLPFFVLSLTSFVKLSVVFSILRNALGAGQFPSAAVVTLLSLVLTLHIMAPVAKESMSRIEKAWAAAGQQAAQVRKGGEKGGPRSEQSGVAMIKLVLSEAAEPLSAFLKKHSRRQERIFFSQLAQRQMLQGEDSDAQRRQFVVDLAEQAAQGACAPPPGGVAAALPGESAFSLIPAFVVSELRAAFAIGFMVYLPFLVVDLVVANLLMGLGMMMMSPVTVSMPLKLILFVVSDGWYLICRGLVLGYL